MEVFSDFIYDNMVGFDWTGRNLGLALLYGLPGEVASGAPAALDDLMSSVGFQELDVPGYARMVTNVNDVVGDYTEVVIGADYDVPITEQSFVAAGVFYIDGTVLSIDKPWVLITDVCFNIVVTPGSRVAAVPAQSAYDTVFAYSIQGTRVIPTIGRVVLSPGPQEWEPSRMYHVYLYPQRVNWLPNPSFENTSNFGWRADGAITRTVGGVDSPANYYLNVDGTRLECVPAPDFGISRLSAYVRSDGATWIQMGLLSWYDNYIDFVETLSTQRPISDAWGHVDVLMRPRDDVVAHSFLVVSDGPFDIDMAMMESHSDLNAYFDGDSQTGMVGDFSWQGAPHESYSFWYNNRYLAGARVFGEYTEGLVTKRGLVYDWIPFDSALATHWNVLTTTDTRHPLKDWDNRLIP